MMPGPETGPKDIGGLEKRTTPEVEGESVDYSREAYEQADSEVKSAEEKRSRLYEQAHDEALELKNRWEKTERKEPTLKAQAQVYAEMFDIKIELILKAAQSLRAEMSGKEREKLTLLVYTPKGETADKAWERVKLENPTVQTLNPTNIRTAKRVKGHWHDTIKTYRETDKASIAFACFSKNPDEDSLGTRAMSPENWMAVGKKFMSPKQAMIARIAFYRLTGKQMDDEHYTMFPGFRVRERSEAVENSSVPLLSFRKGKVGLGNIHPREPLRGPVGTRQVVSREIES